MINENGVMEILVEEEVLQGESWGYLDDPHDLLPSLPSKLKWDDLRRSGGLFPGAKALKKRMARVHDRRVTRRSLGLMAR